MSQPTKRKSRTTNPIGGKNMFGKGKFGGGMIFKTQVVNGTCPTCETSNLFLYPLSPEFFRCTTCGTDLEQKVNGVISIYSRLHFSRGQNTNPRSCRRWPAKSLEAYGFVHVRKSNNANDPDSHAKKPNKRGKRKKSRGQG